MNFVPLSLLYCPALASVHSSWEYEVVDEIFLSSSIADLPSLSLLLIFWLQSSFDLMSKRKYILSSAISMSLASMLNLCISFTIRIFIFSMLKCSPVLVLFFFFFTFISCFKSLLLSLRKIMLSAYFIVYISSANVHFFWILSSFSYEEFCVQIKSTGR